MPMPEAQPTPFVSKYSWLVAPGDSLQVDYTTPTRVRTWLQAKELSPLLTTSEDKQERYGQWIAQLLQNQLGIPLVDLYTSGGSAWPLTLREDVIALFDDYFASHEADEPDQVAT